MQKQGSEKNEFISIPEIGDNKINQASDECILICKNSNLKKKTSQLQEGEVGGGPKAADTGSKVLKVLLGWYP